MFQQEFISLLIILSTLFKHYSLPDFVAADVQAAGAPPVLPLGRAHVSAR
jgi:hypothetical protein